MAFRQICAFRPRLQVRDKPQRSETAMEFFGMGPLEILLILIVGLIAFGPGRLPQLARNLGKGIAAFKKAAFELTAEVSKEFEEVEKEDNEPQGRKGQPKDDTEQAAKHDAGKSTR